MTMRQEAVSGALSVFPVSIYDLTSARRNWYPPQQEGYIVETRQRIERIEHVSRAIAVLAQNDYPLVRNVDEDGIGPFIHVVRKADNDPPLTVTISEKLQELIEPHLVLNPDIYHEDSIWILCVFEAISEFLGVRLKEEIAFLEYIKEEVDPEAD